MICVEDIDLDAFHRSDRPLGKKSRESAIGHRGRSTRSRPYKRGEPITSLAVDASVRAALARRSRQFRSTPFCITAEDLRKKQMVFPGQRLIVLVVDASDSMGQGTTARMKAAKGAALALLAKARLKRYHVGVVSFRDRYAAILLPFTQSITLARDRLRALPTGGATPLADGLMQARRMIMSRRHNRATARPLMVLISDGEANIPLEAGDQSVDIVDELRCVAGQIAADGIQSVLIDTKSRSTGSMPMLRLSKWLQGAYYHIDGLRAGHVVQFVLQSDA